MKGPCLKRLNKCSCSCGDNADMAVQESVHGALPHYDDVTFECKWHD